MTWIKGWDVESSSNNLKVYRVSIDEHGGWGCSCPAWTLQGHKECKHIRQIKAEESVGKPQAKRILDFAAALKTNESTF